MTQIEWQAIERLVEAEDVTMLSLGELQQRFRNEREIRQSRPDGLWQIDPRNGDKVLFVTSRHDRPQDTRPADREDPALATDCPICNGRTTRIVDLARLSIGATFINKNLYPVFYPYNDQEEMLLGSLGEKWPGPEVRTVTGLHFVQWTSSNHDVDWHNLPLEDGLVVMSRLAALEETLLTSPGDNSERYVLITKNYGHLVGSSLAHGHQQIALSNVMPRRFRDNIRFAQKQGMSLVSYLQEYNPRQLIVRDYGPVQLLVPYFMRRPYDMMLIVKNSEKQFLYQLNREELTAVAAGWGDAIRAIMAVMPERGREVAYNVICNNGRGAGLIFEFLPYTQEMGSLEHLGLMTSEAQPATAAEELREALQIDAD
ncbi:MAG: hypothetical protein R3293_09810 [Candidatus Promineifilaceae bacterium]|nr:hypothetical protein [Candidatus Promineifilaceae bacterium]